MFSQINLLYEYKIIFSCFLVLLKVLQDPVHAAVYGSALGSTLSAVGRRPIRIFHGRVSVAYHRHPQPHLVGQQRSAQVWQPTLHQVSSLLNINPFNVQLTLALLVHCMKGTRNLYRNE